MNPRLAAIAARAQLELEQPGSTSAGTHEQTISSEVLDYARQQARHALRDLDSRVAYVASRAKAPVTSTAERPLAAGHVNSAPSDLRGPITRSPLTGRLGVELSYHGGGPILSVR